MQLANEQPPHPDPIILLLVFVKRLLCAKRCSNRWERHPADPRFPNTDQTRHCFQNYLDYHPCNKVMKRCGKDTSPCDWYQKVPLLHFSPSLQVRRWKDQLKDGTFPGKI
uniref:Cytochrome c oxidase subunit 6B2 n=1 Tax=Ornithorhynchus anatinus TaxID=9258 RepID=A0A6I8P4J0_ORNAN